MRINGNGYFKDGYFQPIKSFERLEPKRLEQAGKVMVWRSKRKRIALNVP